MLASHPDDHRIDLHGIHRPAGPGEVLGDRAATQTDEQQPTGSLEEVHPQLDRCDVREIGGPRRRIDQGMHTAVDQQVSRTVEVEHPDLGVGALLDGEQPALGIGSLTGRESQADRPEGQRA